LKVSHLIMQILVRSLSLHCLIQSLLACSLSGCARKVGTRQLIQDYLPFRLHRGWVG
jgi:hypothetical protein